MRTDIKFSPMSLQDLDEIWEYVAITLENRQAAGKIVDDILDKVQLLEDFPEMGTPMYRQTGIGSEYRFLICGSYLVFYRPSEASVYIDRILYRKRECVRILLGGQNLQDE